jgi:hypothetical protein
MARQARAKAKYSRSPRHRYEGSSAGLVPAFRKRSADGKQEARPRLRGIWRLRRAGPAGPRTSAWLTWPRFHKAGSVAVVPSGRRAGQNRAPGQAEARASWPCACLPPTTFDDVTNCYLNPILDCIQPKKHLRCFKSFL